MKDETKNEMDLLLRRLGRRDETSASNADGAHLDADELSAYAENALPGAARARYTAHLAECSRCRELVVQLSSSVGVVAATETAKVSTPSTWKTFLASLFTPMVLRYAAPALGLIVVAAIGFVVLRQSSPGYVTQVTNNEQRSLATPPAAEPSASTNDSVTKSATNSPGLADSGEKKRPEQAASAPVPNAAPVVTSVESEVSRDKAAAAPPKPEEQTAVANEPPPPAKAAPSATPEASQKNTEAEEKQKQVQGVTNIAPAAAAGREFRVQQREDRDTNFVKDGKRKPADKAGAQIGSVAKLERGEQNLSANTRTVAGRRFEKKGGVWIDTEYDSSKNIVTLGRGSEQYRALVADEPQIKTIADELDGEILIVWKGHTYRIR